MFSHLPGGMSINTIRKVDAIRGMIAIAFFASNSWYMFHILCMSWIFLMTSFYRRNRVKGLSGNIYPYRIIILMIIIILIGFIHVWFGFAFGLEKLVTSENYVGFLKINLLAIITLISIFGSLFIVSRSSLSDLEIAKIFRFIVLCGVISAFGTLIFWFMETGGNWGRYNYIPPFTNSQGVQLYYLAISFLAGITLITSSRSYWGKKALYLYLSCGIILLCMTTILVREGWVIFSISLMFAFSKLGKSGSFKKYLKLTIFLVFILFFAFFLMKLTKETFKR